MTHKFLWKLRLRLEWRAVIQRWLVSKKIEQSHQEWRNETGFISFSLFLQFYIQVSGTTVGIQARDNTLKQCSKFTVWKERSKLPVEGDGEICSWELVLPCSNTTSAQQDLEILDDSAKLMGVGDRNSSSFCAASVQFGHILTDGYSSPLCAILKSITLG